MAVDLASLTASPTAQTLLVVGIFAFTSWAGCAWLLRGERRTRPTGPRPLTPAGTTRTTDAGRGVGAGAPTAPTRALPDRAAHEAA